LNRLRRHFRSFFARRFAADEHYGMDITEIVKRNNSAPAQYDWKSCGIAQNGDFPSKRCYAPARTKLIEPGSAAQGWTGLRIACAGKPPCPALPRKL